MIAGVIFLFNQGTYSQDASNLLDEMMVEATNEVSATFKSTRIINGHSIEQPAEGELEFRISHRFGRLNEGAYELWGLDQATIHFSLEYNPVKFLTIGIGRSNYNKTYDGFAKMAILKQTTGERNFPFFLTYFTSLEYVSLKNELPEFKTEHRLSYVHQLLVARKFNKWLSLQLTPSYIHRNLVETSKESNDLYSLGIGGRIKLTKRLSVNAETFLVDHGETPDGVNYYVPFSVGIDLETGGHVFQIMVTNAQAMREAAFIGQTTGSWSEGDLHLGFNISRMFSLTKN